MISFYKNWEIVLTIEPRLEIPLSWRNSIRDGRWFPVYSCVHGERAVVSFLSLRPCLLHAGCE